jgi:hypothetical protein
VARSLISSFGFRCGDDGDGDELCSLVAFTSCLRVWLRFRRCFDLRRLSFTIAVRITVMIAGWGRNYSSLRMHLFEGLLMMQVRLCWLQLQLTADAWCLRKEAKHLDCCCLRNDGID